jgi:uncharacterized protein YecE (DUF72 family)
MVYYVGTSGWSYDHWINVFYPEDLKKKQWLSFYSQHFATVELNMSFYRYPFKNMLKGWKNKLPQDFKMTFKAHRQITHRKKFQDVKENLERFYAMVGELGSQAGCVLFQVPPSFRNNAENRAILTAFLELTDPAFDNVMEFRHTLWWDQDIIHMLGNHHVAFCTVSGLGMPPDIMVSNDFAYFRFHGPDQAYASEYTDEQLENWAGIIHDAIEQNDIQRVYCYFNNDFHGYAVKNAKRLNQMLQGLVQG